MTMSSDADAIRAIQSQLGEALTHKDLDGAISLMTADVTFVGARGPAVVGHEAVRRLYANLFDHYNITVSRADCTLEIVGDAAVVIGSETILLAPVHGGPATSLSGRVVGVYRRDNGSWRLARALGVWAGMVTARRNPAYTFRADLLTRAQAQPGRIIYPEVA